jgi:EcsC protein family
MPQLSEKDLAILTAAVTQLESPSLAGKLAAVVGMPTEKLLGWLPDSIQVQIDRVTEEALTQALNVAMKTLVNEKGNTSWNLTHKVAATISGVTGGLFGAPALFAELPVTTVIILRSIADIARARGENLSDPAVQLACLEVFALGSGGKQQVVNVLSEEAQAEEEHIRATYFVARAAMAQQVSAAAEILTKGTASGSSTALTRLISRIASRFGIAVSEKAAAQAIPIVGAIGGGLINALFMDHFQNTAEAHFCVRQLERVYGTDAVRKEYERLAAKETNSH